VTDFLEQSASCETDSCSAGQDTLSLSSNFMKWSQDLATGPYPATVQFSPHLHPPSLPPVFRPILASHHRYSGLPSGSSLSYLPTKFLYAFLVSPRVLHFRPASFCLIYSLLYHWRADPVAARSEARALISRTLVRGFESRLRQGCLSSSFYVVLSCVGRGLATS
jgi:hypothetical protein